MRDQSSASAKREQQGLSCVPSAEHCSSLVCQIISPGCSALDKPRLGLACSVPCADPSGLYLSGRKHQRDALSCMQARFAVLSAMDTYLHASPAVQRAAVRRWQPIAAIFALLWDATMQKVALSMVSSRSPSPHTSFILALICRYRA